jgi:serine/threonine protein kinase
MIQRFWLTQFQSVWLRSMQKIRNDTMLPNRKKGSSIRRHDHATLRRYRLMNQHSTGLDVPDLCKLLDFGLVKDTESQDEEPTLTHVGTLAGIPAFMSPEQIADATKIDCRSDIYSLGALAYFLLASRPPFEGSPVQVLADHLYSVPKPIRDIRSDVPDSVAERVESCLEKNPENRPSSIEMLKHRLCELAELFPWTEAEAMVHWNGSDATIGAG